MDGLKVYDPYAFTYVKLNESATAHAVADYVPVRSLSEGKWFAVYLPSNRSHTLSDMNTSVRTMVEREIGAHELTERLTEVCENIRAGFYSESDKKVSIDLVEDYGVYAFTRSQARLRAKGFTPDEITEGLTRLDDETDMKSVVEGVEVVDVNELAEGA